MSEWNKNWVVLPQWVANPNPKPNPLILSTGVVKIQPEACQKACGCLSKAHHWSENGQETFNYILELLYEYLWPSRFGYIFRRPIINSLLIQTSWMFFFFLCVWFFFLFFLWKCSLCSTHSIMRAVEIIGGEDCHDIHVFLFFCFFVFFHKCM